jgi:release factor glutamine methyltransferase
MPTIAAVLALAQKSFASSDTPRLDAEILLSYVLKQDRAYLYTWPEQELAVDEQQNFMILTERRARGEPVAYLSGYRDFWNFSLQVNDSTLIPRPETELLVEQALQRLPETYCRVLDLGTGSGAIALALAVEREAWKVFGCDLNDDAVKLAVRNAHALGASQAHFFQSHWFDKVEERNFDLIVGNPPYIDEADEHLQMGDVRFEPRSALVAEKNGFAALEWIMDHSRTYLRPGGWLMLEHGFAQGEEVRLFMRQCGYESVETCRDLADCERVSLGQWQARS